MVKKKNRIFIIIFLGFGCFLWGTVLIHSNYALRRNITYILKSGDENISKEIISGHSEQASKEVGVHLGLVVGGVLLIVFSIIKIRRKVL